MRMTFAALALLVVPLAGCGSNEEPASKSDTASVPAGGGLSLDEVEQAAEKASDAVRPEPGEYRATVEITEFDMPGAPPEAKRMMQGMMRSSSHTYCLTKDDVSKGFEKTVRQSRAEEDGDCTFQKFDVDGGTIDAKMTCKVKGQGAMTMTMVGTGSPTRSQMDMTMQGQMGEMGDTTIRMKALHERIGDCS